MKTKSIVGTLAGIVLAGSMVAGAAPRGPQGMDQEEAQPSGEPGGAMMDRQGPMGHPPMGMPPGGSGMARGEGSHGPMGHPPMGFDVERAKKAGATEAQIQTLDDFEVEQATKRIDLQAAAEKAEIKLNYLMKAKTLDEKAVMQAVEALNQAHGELFKLGIASLLKEKEVLGADLVRKLHEVEPHGKKVPGMPGPHGHDKAPAGQNAEMCPPVEMK